MKKAVWLLVGLLMAAALVLASCSSDSDETDTTTELPTASEGAAPVTGEQPKYGGRLKVMGYDPSGWDPALQQMGLTVYSRPVTSMLVTLDWWKGPAGSNEWSFPGNGNPPDDIYLGDLAESWEILSPTKVIYHLRQGVMWQHKPGVMQAREVTADDIVWNWERFIAEPTHDVFESPTEEDPMTPVALDRYTVEFSWVEPSYNRPVMVIGRLWFMIPPEVVEEFGDMNDWRTVTGSGPFALVDYVSGSVLSYERNPNWHRKDPEGRSLPYIDGFDVLILPDLSTQMTAMRSGQIDMIYGFNAVAWQGALELIETNPELEFVQKVSAAIVQLKFDMKAPPFGPMDDPDAALVRRAAAMAIDRQSIVEDYYQGNATIVPSLMAPQYGIEALKVENLPESSRELYEYDPDRARELLTEAGYPDGIKIQFHTGYEDEIFTIVEYMWDAVGIETELHIMDYAALLGMMYNNTITDVALHWWGQYFNTGYEYFTDEDGVPSAINPNAVNSPELNALIDALDEEFDTAERWNIVTDIQLLIISQAWDIPLPVELTYTFWQPWVRGYSGEAEVAYSGPTDVPAYIWLDEDYR